MPTDNAYEQNKGNMYRIHTYIHKHKSEQKLVRSGMNTPQKRYIEQSQVLVLGPDKRGIIQYI